MILPIKSVNYLHKPTNKMEVNPCTIPIKTETPDENDIKVKKEIDSEAEFDHPVLTHNINTHSLNPVNYCNVKIKEEVDTNEEYHDDALGGTFHNNFDCKREVNVEEFKIREVFITEDHKKEEDIYNTEEYVKDLDTIENDVEEKVDIATLIKPEGIEVQKSKTHLSFHETDTENPSFARKIHLCTICPFQTTGKNLLRRHFSRNHSGYKSKKKCQFCEKTFTKKPTLDDHMLKQHKTQIIHNLEEFITSTVHKCKQCDYETTYTTSLNNHLRTAHNEYKTELKCHFCPKILYRKTEFDDHLLKQHQNHIQNNPNFISTKVHKCKICDFVTTHKASLHFHRIKTHDESKINCQFCDKTFVRKHSLDNHLIKTHQDQIKNSLDEYITTKVHKCRYCEFETIATRTLNNHLRIAHDEHNDEIQCPLCSKVFHRKYALENHLLKGHRQQAACR